MTLKEEIESDEWARTNKPAAGCLALTGFIIFKGVVMTIEAHEKYLEIKEGIHRKIQLLFKPNNDEDTNRLR